MSSRRSTARPQSDARTRQRSSGIDRGTTAHRSGQSEREHTGAFTSQFAVGAFTAGRQASHPANDPVRPGVRNDAAVTNRSVPSNRPARTALVAPLPSAEGRSRRSRRPAGAPNGTTVSGPGRTQRNASERNRTSPVEHELFAATPVPEVPADTTFAALGVPSVLIAPLSRLGAERPFPIQAATLPETLAGRDVLGRGRTGSGKTIAFAVPLVTRLAGGRTRPGHPRGLVLLPTRELALQVQRTIAPLAKAVGLRTATVFGGVGYGNQTAALKSGVDILVSCPGRLEDLISQGHAHLSDVDITVLDEADHMADLGFLPGVRRLLRATRPSGQRMLFSATLDNGISVLVNDFLTDPAVHAVDDEHSTIETMTHHVFVVTPGDRNQVIRELASGAGRRLMFTRTKHGAKKWAAALSKHGIAAVDLHGNLSQNARERNLAAFMSGTAPVLVATDIAARGIHVDDIELVVHIDPPAEHKAYLHRSGRTARAGAGGTVVTVMLEEQAADVRVLMRKAGITPAISRVVPGSPALAAVLAG